MRWCVIFDFHIWCCALLFRNRNETIDIVQVNATRLHACELKSEKKCSNNVTHSFRIIDIEKIWIQVNQRHNQTQWNHKRKQKKNGQINNNNNNILHTKGIHNHSHIWKHLAIHLVRKKEKKNSSLRGIHHWIKVSRKAQHELYR